MVSGHLDADLARAAHAVGRTACKHAGELGDKGQVPTHLQDHRLGDVMLVGDHDDGTKSFPGYAVT